MVQAAARGVLDFTQADPYDRKWLLKLNWTLKALEHEDAALAWGVLHQHWLAASALKFSAEGVKTVWTQADGAMQQRLRLLYPDIALADQQQEVQQLRDAWVDTFGDPDSPEVKAEIQQLLNYFAANARK